MKEDLLPKGTSSLLLPEPRLTLSPPKVWPSKGPKPISLSTEKRSVRTTGITPCLTGGLLRVKGDRHHLLSAPRVLPLSTSFPPGPPTFTCPRLWRTPWNRRRLLTRPYFGGLRDRQKTLEGLRGPIGQIFLLPVLKNYLNLDFDYKIFLYCTCTLESPSK